MWICGWEVGAQSLMSGLYMSIIYSPLCFRFTRCQQEAELGAECSHYHHLSQWLGVCTMAGCGPAAFISCGWTAAQMDRHGRNIKQYNRQCIERKGKCLQRASDIRTKCNFPLIVMLAQIFSVTTFFLPLLISQSLVESSFSRLWKASLEENEWALKVWMHSFCILFYLKEKVELDFQSHITDLFCFKILPLFLRVSEMSQNTP